MSTPVNYYIGVKFGNTIDPEAVVAGTGSAGATVDVEVRMQIDNGTGTTGLTRQGVNVALQALLAFINGGGSAGAGANLPAL